MAFIWSAAGVSVTEYGVCDTIEMKKHPVFSFSSMMERKREEISELALDLSKAYLFIKTDYHVQELTHRTA